MEESMQPYVQHDTERQQFYTMLSNERAHLDYEPVDASTLELKRTFVPEGERGRGVGSALVTRALEYARGNGFSVQPSCPFVRHVLENE